MKSVAINGDCMDFLRGCEDKAFDLAIVDPEYGANFQGPCGRFERYGRLQSVNEDPPDADYFRELFRVSANQIIWGGNYFDLPPTRGFIIWDKQQPEGVTFASCEFAWSSFDCSARTFYRRPQGDVRIHPTQKPVELYAWLLQNYAKPGHTILDTHLGSGSSRIACYDLGFDFTGIELDKDYFDAQEKRFAEHIAQPNMFAPETAIEQPQMFAQAA